MENYEQNRDGGKKTLWIIGGIVLVIAIIGVIYGATQHTLKKTGRTNDTNVPLNDQSALNEQSGTVAAANRESVTPKIEGIDVVNLQTFPYRVQVRVRGTVPDSCSTFDTPTVQQSGKMFTLSVAASREKDAMCAQVVTSQAAVADLPVSGLAAGTYTVKLGTFSKTFTLSSDNSVQYSGDK